MYKTVAKVQVRAPYVCIKCDTVAISDDTNDTLPPCPKCNNVPYRKISSGNSSVWI
ncbi:hypothetical protein [Thomasclavelia spiroformis]|uniref:hypothetical protein n=1 Tax=Thomasclavelia spiroformis TaxID=29348 RepID=UPI000586B7D0|nr:hypothetical protein [Thomasclavelia spiroformis]